MLGSGIALFGGSFNPIHHGHLIVARSVAEHLDISKVILIPSASPPHKQGSTELAEARHRLEMVRAAVGGERLFEVSDIEILRSGPSYTIHTVQAFRQSLGSSVPLYWIIGADSLLELGTWYRIRELADACRIITAARPGLESPDLAMLEPMLTPEQIRRLVLGILPTPRIDISSTDIRRRIREGRSIRYLVPRPVAEYIEAQRLYRQS